MQAFRNHTGLVLPLDRANVDTDQIIPAQFLKRIERTGFGPALFYAWRYESDGRTPKPDFVLNLPRYQGASVLLARSNFGCGSSREHAPLSIKAVGIGAVVARSFARIFYRNAVNLGLPVIRCPELVDAVREGDEIEVDVLSGIIRSGGRAYQGEAPSAVARRISEAGSLVELIRTRGWAAIEEVI